MIKFFRLSRFRFLNQKKMYRYLLYAAGEIVLVIVGILLALQINTWNENRKLANREIYVLEKLLDEFRSDSTRLDRYIFLTDMKVERGKRIKEMINGDIEVDSSFLNIHAFFNGRVLIFEGYTPTFDELISTGNLNILRNQELVDKIKKLNNDIRSSNNFIYQEAMRRKEAYNQHLYRYFEAETMTFLWEGAGEVNDDELNRFESDINGFMRDPETLYHINVQVGTDKEMHWRYKERTMMTLNDILSMLISEINLKTK